MKRNFFKSFIICMLIALPVYLSAQNKTGFHVLKNYLVKSGGGWDYITVDAATNRLYVSHGDQVNILNAATGDSISYIPGTKGVHGIALAADLGKGYTSNGDANSVSVFDLKTNKVIKQIKAGNDPDAIFYDGYSKKVYAFNGRSNSATVIDAVKDVVVATIKLGGKPETGVSDGKGRIFVNIESTNEEVVIDARTLKILHRWKLGGAKEPTGLAIDEKTGRLFIGCGGSKTMVVMDAANGHIRAKFPIGGCDGVAFDPVLKLAYASNWEGTLSVVKELSVDKFEFVENIKTEQGARTLCVDTVTHHIYLPTAKTRPAKPTAKNKHPWPEQVPGTFHVVVVGK